MRGISTRAGALVVVSAMTLVACGDPQADPPPVDPAPATPAAAPAAADTAGPKTGDVSPGLLFIMEEGFAWPAELRAALDESGSIQDSLRHELETQPAPEDDGGPFSTILQTR